MPIQNETTSLKQEYVVFELNDEYYSVKVEELDSIIYTPPIRSVPNLHNFIRGIIDFEEQIVPVIDLKQCMKLATANPKEPFVLLFTYNDYLIGILVDRILELKESVAPPKKGDTYLSEDIQRFSNGCLRMTDTTFNSENNRGEELVILLSMEKIFKFIKKETDKDDIQ